LSRDAFAWQSPSKFLSPFQQLHTRSSVSTWLKLEKVMSDWLCVSCLYERLLCWAVHRGW